MSRQIAIALLTAFMAATLIAPAALINKVLFAALVVQTLVLAARSRGAMPLPTLAPLVVIAAFLYGYSVSLAADADRDLAAQFMLSVALLLLIYPICWCKIDVDPIVKICGVLQALATIAFLVALVVFPDSALAEPLLDYFADYALGASGDRDFVSEPALMFHLGSAPFLFLPLSLFFASWLEQRRVRDLFAIVLLGVVVLLSASRGLLIACIAAAFVIVALKLRMRARLVLTATALVGSIVILEILLASTQLFSADEFSNQVKLGHARSFVEHLTLPRAMFGEGLAATYFSSGRNAVVAHTEITPFDLTRYLGAPLCIAVYLALLLPRLRASTYAGRERHVLLAAIFLGLSVTNPVLVNSYGFLVVLWYWSRLLVPPTPDTGGILAQPSRA